jgi:hypothetical protein
MEWNGMERKGKEFLNAGNSEIFHVKSDQF